MTNAVIESRGFSASTAISKTLGQIPESYVVHGSQNFAKQTPVGVEDTDISQFTDHILEYSQEYRHCFSVHSLFNPSKLAEACRTKNIRFYGLVRDQKDQITSCYNWFMNGLLTERTDFLAMLVEGHGQSEQFLRQIGLPSTLKNHALFKAINLIVSYNLQLCVAAPEIFFMEDTVSDPSKLLERIDFAGELEDAPQVQQKNSHRARLEKFGSLDTREELDHICDKLCFTIDGKSVSFAGFEDQLNNKRV